MKKNNFLEGALIATIAIFFSKFLGIIYVIPFYSIVGTKGGALYGYAYNIYNLFLIISTAGIPLAISKLTSEYNALNKYKEKEYMFKVMKKIIFIFSIICFLICFIFAKVIAYLIIGNITGGNSLDDIAFVIRCVSFALLIVPIQSIYRGYLQGHKYITPASLSQVIEQIARVVVIIGGSFTALKILNLSLRTAVGVAVFGACVGALVGYIYLINKLELVKSKEKSNTEDISNNDKKLIIKKIFLYALPFIITSVANSIYNSIDMVLLIKGLNYLKYNINDIEEISSVLTTWGNKINVIVTSIATGVALSLVPSISESNALKDNKGINDKINKTILIFFYIALPLSILISIFSKEIWTIFYGNSYYGPIILRMSILIAAIDSLYIMICNALQGLNETKLVYKSVLTGLLINLILDVPLMILFNKLHIHAFYGAIFATIIGYSISSIIPFKTLIKKYSINFKEVKRKLPRILFGYVIIILISLLIHVIIRNIVNRILLLLLMGITGLLLIIVYYFIHKDLFKELLKGRRK